MAPIITLIVAAALSIAAFFVSASFDAWLAGTTGRRKAAEIIKILFATATAILLCLPAWDTLFTDGASTKDLVLASLAAVLLCLMTLIECVQARQGIRNESEVETLRKERDNASDSMNQAKADEFFYRWASECFLKAVGEKADRFQDAAHNRKLRIDQSHSLAELRGVVDANHQIVTLIQIIYQLYGQLLFSVNNKAKLRVAYLCADRYDLKLRYAWNGTDQNFLTSLPNRCKQRFKLSGEPKCCAADAAKTGRITVISDTETADNDPNCRFQFCHSEQKHYLRSLLVLPIQENDGKNVHRHVICIDTDEPNFFVESQRKQYEFVQNQLEKRLLVELAVEHIFGAGKR